MNAETRNAIVKCASIRVDDHNCLTVWLDLDYGGTGQGFGGYALYLPKCFTHHNPAGPNYAGHFIWRVMEICGASQWDDVPGKTIRVKAEHSKAHAIGHIVSDVLTHALRKKFGPDMVPANNNASDIVLGNVDGAIGFCLGLIMALKFEGMPEEITGVEAANTGTVLIHLADRFGCRDDDRLTEADKRAMKESLEAKIH